MACSPAILSSRSECFRCALTERQLWASVVYLLCSGQSASSGSSQILQYGSSTPSVSRLVPPNPNAPAIAYQSGGTGPTYVWNPVTHTWDDGGIPPAITLYDEDVEWTFAASAGTIVGNSAANPHTGLLSVLAINALPGDQFTLTSPSAVAVNSYTSLSLWIQPNVWAVAAAISIFWDTGNVINIQNGKYGFDNSIAAYQNVVIPISDFGVVGSVLVLTIYSNPKTVMGFYLDTVILQP